MTTTLSGPELYELFLLNDRWWHQLSLKCRWLAGYKCERCGKEGDLIAHHKVYRETWWDTRLEDLECLCRDCHKVAHGAVVVKPIEPKERLVWKPRGVRCHKKKHRKSHHKKQKKQSFWHLNPAWSKKQKKRWFKSMNNYANLMGRGRL